MAEILPFVPRQSGDLAETSPLDDVVETLAAYEQGERNSAQALAGITERRDQLTYDDYLAARQLLRVTMQAHRAHRRHTLQPKKGRIPTAV